MSKNWNQPKCERCWVEDETKFLDDGDITIRMPAMVRESGINVCAYCGALTIVGIFVRADPDTVRYPQGGKVPYPGGGPT